MTDIAIRVDGLSKQYRIGGPQERYKTLRDTISDVMYAPFRRVRSAFQRSNVQTLERSNVIWALKDVSFEVKPGEVVGIIGRNGAGKTTVLKILSRITEPTEGYAEIHGRVASLLEVGTGFHPELTGRENIYLNGAILGMKKAEIERKFDEIVAFAEIEKFMDTPVKHYSSGMYVRLAFAVAAHLEPEILLVDEVLAVGDLAFQKKCLGKMEDVAHEGRTILFVSHNMQAVGALCARSLLLDGGGVIVDAPTPATIGAYYNNLRQLKINADTDVTNPKNRRGSGAVRFTRVRVHDVSGRECSEFLMSSTILFTLSFETFAEVDNLFVSVALRSGRSGEFVTDAWHPVSREPLSPGYADTVVIEFPKANLRPGNYPLYFWLGNRRGQPFDVVDDLTAPLTIYTDRDYEDLGFDPMQAVGFFNIESQIGLGRRTAAATHGCRKRKK